MAGVTPFRGLRYRDDVALDDVVAPPYDVIRPDLAAELRARSPYNAVHVDLPVGPGEPATDAAYAAAGAAFAAWRREGILRRDGRPSFYLLDQTYAGPDGRERTRRGIVARLRLAGLGERVVLPHERTHSGPKEDRLRLYRAAHADLSQIFLLAPDDDGRLGEALAATAAAPGEWREARDGDGNRHRIAPFSGAAADRVTEVLRSRALYLADGHHRYETALAYRDERRAAGDPSADTLMVYLCSLSDPGLTVFPTHRLLRGIEPPPAADLAARLRPYFDVVGAPVRGGDACRAALEDLAAAEDPVRTFGLYLPREQTCLTIRAREEAAAHRLAESGFSEAAAGLSVTILHELLFRETLGLSHEDVEHHVDYAKSVPDAFAALAGGAYTLGAFVNATRVDQVRAIADRGEVMPQKSTYFYPKLLAGLVYDALGD